MRLCFLGPGKRLAAESDIKTGVVNAVSLLIPCLLWEMLGLTVQDRMCSKCTAMAMTLPAAASLPQQTAQSQGTEG